MATLPSNNYTSITVSRLKHVKDPDAVTLTTLGDVVAEVKNPIHAEAINALRQTYRVNRPKYAKDKFKLPAVVFAGAFSTARDEGLLKHSGLMVLDFDGLPSDEVQRIKPRLATDPHSVLVFTSPSGEGIKWVVHVEATDAASHHECWQQAVNYAEQTHGIYADMRGGDVSRKCFLPHDANILVSEASESFTGEIRVVISGGTEGHDFHALQDGHRDSLSGSFLKKERLSELDLAPFLPDRPKANHNVFLWNLARLVKGYEMKAKVDYPYEDIAGLVQRWFTRSKPEFRPHSLDHYEGEFFDMLKRCRSPLNGNGEVWETACARADASPPPIALQETSEVSRRFIALCYHLSFGKRRSFALPQEKVAKHLKCTQPYICGRIAILERRGLLRKVASHSRYQRLAAEYEWTGED